MSDEEARRRIEQSLDESLIVEAAAGTGKTTALIGRLLNLIRTGRVTVDRIVAVTFTRKAAGELKLRLRAGLDQARAESQNPEEIVRLEKAVASLEESHVGTIHSFCAELLRERPIEACIDPAFKELSEHEAPRLFQRAFRPWMEEKLSAMPPGLERALSRSMLSAGERQSPTVRLQEAAWKLLEWRDYPVPWRRESFDRDREVDSLVELVEDLALTSIECGNFNHLLQQTLRPVRELYLWINRAEKERDRDYDRLEASLVDLLGKLKNDKRKGSGQVCERASRQELLDMRENLIEGLEDFRERADADLAALLQSEFREVGKRYEALKWQAGHLDFVDLLIKTRDLIRDNGRFANIFKTSSRTC